MLSHKKNKCHDKHGNGWIYVPFPRYNEGKINFLSTAFAPSWLWDVLGFAAV